MVGQRSDARSKRRARVWEQVKLALCTIGLLGCGGLAAFAGWIPTDSRAFRFAIHVVLLVAGIWFLLRLVHLRVGMTLVTNTARLIDDIPPTELTPDQQREIIATSYDEIRGRATTWNIPNSELQSLASLLLNQKASRKRVTETVTVHPTHFEKDVSVEMVCAKATGSRLVPIIRPVKGRLIDNFEVKNSSGKDLVTLSHVDSSAALLQVVRYLVRVALPDADLATQSLVEHHFALQLMVSGDLAPPPPLGPDLDADPAALQDLRALAAEYHSRYPIIAVVPEPDIAVVGDEVAIRLRYRYTQSISAIAARSHHVGGRFKASVRKYVLGPPTQFAVRADKALRCSSYHLRINAPEGLLTGEAIFCDGTKIIRRSNEPAGTVSRFHYRTLPPKDQPFAHLYTRDLHRSAVKDPTYYVRFSERLPGSIGRAALAATLLAWIVWIVGINVRTAPDDNIKFISLALAAHAALLTWVGAGAIRLRFGQSLTARVSFLITAFIGALVVLQYVGYASGRWVGSSLDDHSLLFVSNVNWCVLLSLAGVNALYILLTLLIRLRRSMRILDPTP